MAGTARRSLQTPLAGQSRGVPFSPHPLWGQEVDPHPTPRVGAPRTQPLEEGIWGGSSEALGRGSHLWNSRQGGSMGCDTGLEGPTMTARGPADLQWLVETVPGRAADLLRSLA